MMTIKLTLTLGFTGGNEDTPITPITQEVEWPTVPREGEQLMFQGKGYDVLKVTHDFDSSQIVVRCLPWGEAYRADES